LVDIWRSKHNDSRQYTWRQSDDNASKKQEGLTTF
jgi:hypothetical protein